MKTTGKRNVAYDFRELIARNPSGDWSEDLTDIINEPSDKEFETWIFFMRAARGFGGLGDGSLNWNSSRIGVRVYCALFFLLLNFFLLASGCIGCFQRFLCGGQKIFNVADKDRSK